MKQGPAWRRHSVAWCPPGPGGLAEARQDAEGVAYVEADVRLQTQ